MPYLPRKILFFSFGQGVHKERVAPQHSLTVIESLASFLMFDHWKLSTPLLSPPFAPHVGKLIWKHVHSFPWCQRGSSNHPNPSLCMETPVWPHLNHNKNQSHSPLLSLKPFQTSLGASSALLTRPHHVSSRPFHILLIHVRYHHRSGHQNQFLRGGQWGDVVIGPALHRATTRNWHSENFWNTLCIYQERYFVVRKESGKKWPHNITFWNFSRKTLLDDCAKEPLPDPLLVP